MEEQKRGHTGWHLFKPMCSAFTIRSSFIGVRKRFILDNPVAIITFGKLKYQSRASLCHGHRIPQYGSLTGVPQTFWVVHICILSKLLAYT